MRPADLSSRDVTAFAEDVDDALWVGTQTQGLNRIERPSGRSWVESEGEGRGSTFCFTLGPLPAAGEGDEAEGASVLLAEDRFRQTS